MVFSADIAAAVYARKAIALVLAATGICTALYALSSLFLPFGWDHGIIASVGSSYIDGGVPYVDSWDMKGPVAYLPFSLAELLFGSTMWGVRLIDLMIWLVAGYVLFDRVRSLADWRIGLWTAMATYLWIASSGWFFTAAPESWVTASSIIAILPLLAPHRRPGLAMMLACGVLISCAGLVKPFYFTLGAAPLVWLALSPDLDWRRRCRMLAALGLGALVPLFVVAAYFAARGGLEQAIEVHLLFPLSTYAVESTGWHVMFEGISAFAFKMPIALTAPLIIAAIWQWKSQRRLLATLLTWLGVAFFCVALQGKYFVYHWFPAYPPWFILAALGLHGLLRANVSGAQRWQSLICAIVLSCAVLVLAGVSGRPARDVMKLAYYRIFQDDPQSYYSSYNFRMYNSADEIAAASYIAENSDPAEGVYIWGSDSTVAYLADRPSSSRFTFSMPLTMAGEYRDDYRAQVIQQLTMRPPTYFVVGITWDGLGTSLSTLADFPEMAIFLDDNYIFEKQFGVIDIYRLRRGKGASDRSQ